MLKAIKLIVSDIDGTLLDANGEIPKANIQALQECHKRGIKIALCSGRQAADMAQVAKQLKLENIAILSLNGSYCLEQIEASVFWEYKMDALAALECVRRFEAMDLAYNCFSGNVLINNKVPEYEKDPGFWTSERKARRKLVKHLYGQEFIEAYLKRGIHKFSFVELNDKEKLKEIRTAFEGIPNTTLTSSWSCNFEIMPKGVHKGLALQKLCAFWKISTEECLAFGDNDNDIPLFQAAGISVCMENGTPSAKSHAHFHTLNNSEAGLGIFLEDFILKKTVKIP